MKKTYIIPKMLVAFMVEELPIAGSNEVNDDGTVNINPGTIEGGDGGDAVKRNYNVWDDDWQ